MAAASPRASRIGLDVFFLYIGLITLINGMIATQEMRGWILGDWLINYEGGFVRRGLAGEAALLLARFFQASPIFFVVLFYLSLYGVFFLCFRDIAGRAVKNFWSFALILSPATLSFQVLHRGSGFRKEVLYLAALGLFAVLLRKRKVAPLFVATYFGCVLIVSTLCHEGLIFYSPYFVAALMISGRSVAETARVCAIPLLCGIAAFALCCTHLGSAATAGRICSSIGYRLQAVPGSTDICESGAIPYLVKTRAVAGREALSKIENYQYLLVYPGYLLLALLPVAGESFALVRVGMGREIRILWAAFTISFLGTLVLFRYAVDWGRWIYIHIASMALLVLFLEGRRRFTESGSAKEPVSLTPTTSSAPTGRRVLQWVFVFVYATFWILPNDTEPLRMGYAGRVLQVMHILKKPTNAERIPLHDPDEVP